VSRRRVRIALMSRLEQDFLHRYHIGRRQTLGGRLGQLAAVLCVSSARHTHTQRSAEAFLRPIPTASTASRPNASPSLPSRFLESPSFTVPKTTSSVYSARASCIKTCRCVDSAPFRAPHSRVARRESETLTSHIAGFTSEDCRGRRACPPEPDQGGVQRLAE
jgi:hypothetical protein